MALPDDILIVGLGKTGIATAKFLHAMGRRIAVTDAKNEEALAPALKELEGIPFKGYFGGHGRDSLLSYPMIVISPGVDSRLPYLKEAREKGATVIDLKRVLANLLVMARYHIRGGVSEAPSDARRAQRHGPARRQGNPRQVPFVARY